MVNGFEVTGILKVRWLLAKKFRIAKATQQNAVMVAGIQQTITGKSGWSRPTARGQNLEMRSPKFGY